MRLLDRSDARPFLGIAGALLVLLPRAAAGAGPAEPPAARPDATGASYLVLLREQADLSAADAIADPAARRRFVFEALREVANRTQAPLAARLGAAGARTRSHFLVNMLEVEGAPSIARVAASAPEVVRVVPNLPMRFAAPVAAAPEDGFTAESSRSASAVGANLEKIRAPILWDAGFIGQGLVVGDADTGFAWEHPALKAHYRGFAGATANHAYSWHDAVHDARIGNPCGSDAPAPCDDDGHGTSTSGLMVGDDGQEGEIGVAPGAKLIGCRNMDQGNGTPARYTECFEFLLAPTDANGANPRPELGADVINNSWGCPPSEGCTDPEILRSVVANVRAAGIFVVVAAGNGGGACATITDAPAIYDISFCVGATSDADAIASFSSRGPILVDGSNRLKPDIVAPGVNVRTSTPPDGFTLSFSGTSASAPHVAGAVALLWSALPAFRGNVAATEDLLRRSAVPLTGPETCGTYPGGDVPNAVFGYGRLDVGAAFALAQSNGSREPIHLPAQEAKTRVVPPRAP